MIAEKLYKLLNGLICVYKPPGINIVSFGKIVEKYLSIGFNNLPNTKNQILTTVDRSSSDLKIVIADDLISKEKAKIHEYQPMDFECYVVNPLVDFSSGVQVLGIGPCGLALSGKMFEENMYMNVYRLTFMMGRATQSGTPNSKTIFRSGFKQVKPAKLETVLQNLVTHSLNSSFVGAGISPNSQEAFDILSHNGGFVRPKSRPIDDMREYENTQKASGYIYSMQCLDFDPPFFTVETQVVGEDMDLFMNVMNVVSSRLKTGLVMTKCRRVQQGNFDASQCLVLGQLKYMEQAGHELEQHIRYCESQHSFESLQLDGCNAHNRKFIEKGQKNDAGSETVQLFAKPERLLELE